MFVKMLFSFGNWAKMNKKNCTGNLVGLRELKYNEEKYEVLLCILSVHEMNNQYLCLNWENVST